MCGITGILHRDSNRPVDHKSLERMTEVVFHRGPDDSGLWIDGPVGFGHQRLSVIDLQTGHQPMAVEDGNYWITYNGEIYNYIELRQELEERGRVFSTHSDTEVLLQMYAAHGDAALGKLNGMFAFGIWDVRRRRLFAARDRLGIKPFYYFWDGEVLLFASEIKSLLEHDRVAPEVDFHALQDYLDLQYCLGDKTLFKGIKRLLPGHWLSWEEGRLQTGCFWDLDFTPDKGLTEEQFVERLQELMDDAVRLRLRSDVPVGSHLSGGLDSSAIACLAGRHLDGKLHTFTGGFRDGNPYDETRYAQLVADTIGADHHEVFPQADDLAETFADLVYYLDEPIAGAAVFPQYFLSKLASKHVKVVLGGQGGDEIFAGYSRYLIGYLDAGMRQSIYGPSAGEAPVSLEALCANLPYLRGYEPTMERLFAQDLFGASADRYYRLLVRSHDMEGILQGGWEEDGYSTLEAFREEFARPRTDALIDRMSYIDVKNHLQSLLQLEDRTSMAVSLESRLPLLDYRVVEATFAVPGELRFAAGKPKHLLRQAIADLVPRQILERKDKMGFPVPIFEWFNGVLQPFVEDILLGETTRSRGFFDMATVEHCLRSERPFGRTKWGLLSLELWFRKFFDRK